MAGAGGRKTRSAVSPRGRRRGCADVAVPEGRIRRSNAAAQDPSRLGRVLETASQPARSRCLERIAPGRRSDRCRRPDGETESRGVPEVPGYRGGAGEARRRLNRFVRERLDHYARDRNEPTPYSTTELSAHLHFGHISPLTIALEARQSEAPGENLDSLLEELIVRRELAINFIARNPDYDRLSGCPEWARKTLAKHAADPRPVLYAAAELEAGRTHDPLWNAAQMEMVVTGRMHNYLRMYWAKKILQWSVDAETAFRIAIDLNDRYEMDGRDPNGYTGVAWAIGGKHDRPWPERPIFGTVRFMSYESTRKKFNSKAYIAWSARRKRGESESGMADGK